MTRNKAIRDIKRRTGGPVTRDDKMHMIGRVIFEMKTGFRTLDGKIPEKKQNISFWI